VDTARSGSDGARKQHDDRVRECEHDTLFDDGTFVSGPKPRRRSRSAALIVFFILGIDNTIWSG